MGDLHYRKKVMHWCSMHEGHSTAAVQRLSGSLSHSVYPTQYIKIEYKESEVNVFVTSIVFANFICTYHSGSALREACCTLCKQYFCCCYTLRKQYIFCCYTLCKQYFCCYYALHVTNILLNFIPSGLGF